MNTRIIWLLLVFAVLVAPRAIAQVDRDDVPGRLTVRETCPVSLMSVRVEMTDIPTGIAVTFTAALDELQELRRRVELLAKKHHAPAEEPLDVERMPAGAMKYEMLPDGARIILTPADPNRMALFRSEVHALVDKMMEGNCEIMPQAR